MTPIDFTISRHHSHAVTEMVVDVPAADIDYQEPVIYWLLMLASSFSPSLCRSSTPQLLFP
ncbi:hypothetical protein [Synechococcus sp. CBW1108]|uniref:hypothetical protein n=1 Tax=Synechococcus sp. CBW1108 TaxID=1353147 RepID=UPI0018CD4130|nr:hypothetical protein [Synechococcus sp. CBW1108]QPN70113.1 hypothetical protein H8F27_17105 [Synechococcus sp. CBW1108]